MIRVAGMLTASVTHPDSAFFTSVRLSSKS
jgi:hypothetical protein